MTFATSSFQIVQHSLPCGRALPDELCLIRPEQQARARSTGELAAENTFSDGIDVQLGHGPLLYCVRDEQRAVSYTVQMSASREDSGILVDVECMHRAIQNVVTFLTPFLLGPIRLFFRRDKTDKEIVPMFAPE